MAVPVGSSNSSTGLGQGIDVNTFVTAALAFDQAGITAVQNQQAALAKQTTALTKLTTELSSLRDTAFALNDPLGSLNALTTTSSNSGVLTGTANSSAVASSHTITVNSLATTSSYYTDPIATSSTALTTGSFKVQVGSGTTATVTVDGTNNTLDKLAASINSQGIGVQASVINDANGSRLALVSSTTGAPGDVTVSANTTNLKFNKAVTGTNASLTVDGVPISSSSNTVSGVINGVTLSLGSPAPSTPVTLNVTQDTSQATTAINGFVSAYNTAISDLNSQFAVAGDGSGGGPLEADGSAREAQSLLLSAITYSGSGNGAIANLASLGVNLNNDGTLSVNTSQLQSALATNPSAVQSFLQASSNGFAGNLSTVISNIINPGQGVLGLDATGLQQTAQSLLSHLGDLQAAFNDKQASLILVYSQVNATLQELPLLQSQTAQQLASA